MLVIDEEEARVVRLIYTWYVEEGLTVYRIVRRLTEMESSPEGIKVGWSGKRLRAAASGRVLLWGKFYTARSIPAYGDTARKTQT